MTSSLIMTETTNEFCPATAPASLEVACLEFIKTALTNAEDPPCEEEYIHFKRGVKNLPGPFKRSIFEYMGKSGCLSHSSIELLAVKNKSIFKGLFLYNITNSVTGKDLLQFSSYQLTEIVLKFSIGHSDIPSPSSLWEAFKGSEHSLKFLKLFSYPIKTSKAEEHVFEFISKFPNLQTLCIHSLPSQHSQVDNEMWLKLLKCKSLQAIEVYGPENKASLNTSIFSYVDGRLASLCLPAMFSRRSTLDEVFGLGGFLELEYLTHLDISIDDEPDSFARRLIDARDERKGFLADFMTKLGDSNKLPNLVSLDMSGWIGLHSGHIEKLLASHKNISFLGLCLLDLVYTRDQAFVDGLKGLQISGTMLEKQVITSMSIYPNRSIYIREALKSLFVLCGEWTERRPDVIQLVLRVLRNHPKDHLLQLAATACMYNLTKNDAKLKPVPPKQLVEAADLSLQALKNFKSDNKIQIMKNCLLIFCNDRLLHYPKFKRFEVSRECLNCMLTVPESSDQHITRMAVAIVSVLACKITSHETSELTGEKEMKLLLTIAKARLQDERIDGTLKFDLSALWNLTDESPSACHLFVENGGLELYIQLLRIFSEDHSIQTKVLGLLNNIAEVNELHEAMVTDDLMKYVGDLVENEEKSVSYFAGGIIANIAYGWNTKYKLEVTSKQELLEKLENAIERWGRLESEIVTYRSFKPFLGLLDSFHLSPVQHFSLWAIHHVCTLNSERYKELMTPECVVRLARLKCASFSTTAQQRAMVDEVFKACNIQPEEKMDEDIL